MQIIILNDLINIINDINPEEEVSFFNELDLLDFTETTLHIIDQYIKDNPKFISEPSFHEDLKDYILELISIPFEYEFFWNPLLKEEMEDMLDEILELYFITFIPCRSFTSSIIIQNPNYDYVDIQMQYLRSKPQPDQRTKEWYEFRNNLITASNAYKAFENENTQNQLIYEKCNCIKKMEISNDQNILNNDNNFVNVNSTLHWGQKYEKVSVMFYEDKYKTLVEDFGCIQHDTYKFIGASPDGINKDKNSLRYGRMLEIKNIINREIDGIPKKEYWIQMQLQMEVCNLPECDFLETQFTEYDCFSDYNNDNNDSESNIFKGFIMYFANPDGTPFYIYKPLNMLDCDSEQWEQDNINNQLLLNRTWIKNCYWKLEKWSCVLVLRNKQWFEQNVNVLQHIWSIIELERMNGYEHRGPNKRIKKEEELVSNINLGSGSNISFSLNKDNKLNIIKLNNNTNNNNTNNTNNNNTNNTNNISFNTGKIQQDITTFFNL
jgi:putative phage-type endonuclease